MRNTRRSVLTNNCKVIISAVAFLVALSFGRQTMSGLINSPCFEFSGTFIFTAFQFLNAELTEASAETEVWIDGELVGYAEAHYFIERKGQGVNQAKFEHILTFLDGSTLHTQDDGLLVLERNNPGWGRANSRLHIVEGTGVFAGATGLLHTHGELNLFTLDGAIDFKGQLCLPE